jgi:hypothetical protein
MNGGNRDSRKQISLDDKLAFNNSLPLSSTLPETKCALGSAV